MSYNAGPLHAPTALVLHAWRASQMQLDSNYA